VKYLIMPMQPTPNGRMHVGHAAGTYLRADVLARSLRAEGHDVAVACGTDAYENWVLAAATRDGRTPHDSCAYFHDGITRDLTALGVQFDRWIDPLSPEHRQPYVELHQELFAELSAAATAFQVGEQVPYDVDGSPLVGTFIAGECPTCGAAAGGSSCTACGDHFQPDQLVEPRARLSASAIEWRQERNWFLRPRSAATLLADVRATGLHERHGAVVEPYLDRTGGLVRVSGPGTWGVPDEHLEGGHVLANSYYLYCLYAARCVAGPDGPDPFAAGSPIVTVGVFGSDNSMPGLVVPGVYSQATRGRLRAFDHTVINGMLDLDGQKCSTSKGYGIWLEDVLTDTLLTADELRYALCGLDLDDGRANLALAGLVADARWFRRVVAERVGGALSAWGDLPGPDPADAADLAVVERQRRHLQPGSVHLPSARAFLTRELAAPIVDPQRWLGTVAALAEALTPGLGHAIRTGALGPAVVGHGEIRMAALEAVVRRGDRP
jgi:methionyl-tRNA synthetase